MSDQFTIKVNGKEHRVAASGDTMLLYVLRNDLGLQGPKFGCGLGQCGACTVIMDGRAVRSCSFPVTSAQDRAITTLEGLGTAARPHPLQRAFITEQAAQCGMCMNGMILTAKVLLDRTPNPTADQIKDALDGNLCRCASHLRVIRAVQRAARERA
jgi:nicotinate dehydrogenase subunit A